MLVRMNIGAYEGKVRDVRNEEARQMIADGRATDLRVEDGSVPAPAPAELEQPAAAPIPVPEAPKGTKRDQRVPKPPKKRKR